MGQAREQLIMMQPLTVPQAAQQKLFEASKSGLGPAY